LISSEFAGLPGSGGIGTYFDHLARGLVRAGCEVEVFTSGSAGDLPERDGVLFHHLGDPQPPLFAYRVVEAFRIAHAKRPFDVLEYGELKAEGVLAAQAYPEVARVVRLHSPSVILDRYLDFAPTSRERFIFVFNQIRVVIGAKRRGLPLRPIHLEPFFQPWPDGRDNAECHAAAEADVVLVMSEEMRRFAEGHWWIKPEIIRKVPNPYFSKPPAIKKIGGSAGKNICTIGFLGRLEVRKGVVELANALAQELPFFPDWRVELVGREIGTSWTGKNPKAIVEGNLESVKSQIKFLPSIPPDQVEDWFAGIDIFAFPSLWDNFPYVILEAMAAGKAIVATATGAVPEMLGDSALVVPVGDVRAFRNALRKLMADDQFRRILGESAKRRFEERFHPDRVMGEILEVYREAIERAKNRRKEV
jgi:glycosyltransferase involved in cell wall biosynthesis